MRDQVTKYISGQYGVDPEFPWDGDDTSAVFRHRENKKWFALIMEVRRELLQVSFEATLPEKRKKKERPPKAWIIPANPKYYDVESAFAKDDVIDWKQGSGINTGDTVYMYVGSPVSAILYKCKV